MYYLLDVISDKQASKSSNMYDGRTLLHLSAADNDLKLCKRLVADGIDINCLMKTSPTTYMTPYDVAVFKNSAECARYLKSLGGVTGVEIVAKLQSQRLQKKANAILVRNRADSSGEEARMAVRKNKLKSKEKTKLTGIQYIFKRKLL